MTARTRPLAAAFVVTLALFMGWRWQVQRQEVRSMRKAAWERYLQGPLSDLLYGSSRLRPLLVKPRLTPAEKAEAQDAVAHLRESAKQAQVLAVLIEQDGVMRPLADAAPWHQQIYDLLEPWKQLQGKPLAKEAVSTEASLRHQLWALLGRQRSAMLEQGGFSKDDILEMNALLYSLNEHP